MLRHSPRHAPPTNAPFGLIPKGAFVGGAAHIPLRGLFMCQLGCITS